MNWQVQPEHSGNLICLQRLLQRAGGFRLLILQQNRPLYRDGLIKLLRADGAESRVLDLKKDGHFSAFESWLNLDCGQTKQIHLINLESLGKEEQQAFFKGLNYHREHIARTCSGILAFWLPEPLVRELALQAADFWAWREQVLDFSFPVEPVERMTVDWVKCCNLDVSGKQERIKEIEEFLARPAKQPSLIRADLKRELGNLYELIGEYAKAEQVLKEAIAEYRELDETETCTRSRHDLAKVMAGQGKYEQALILLDQQVLPIFQRLSNEREIANTKNTIAFILKTVGQLDEALNIYMDEVLPVYKKIGDAREQAVTMSNIAEILLIPNQLDEALRIYQKEVLPVFEQLGDVRTKAVTMGKIADILKKCGQSDQALKIYQEEVLPVFEQLGDIKTKAIIFGRIAGILQTKGQLDKALEIREQKELLVFEQLGDVHSLLIGQAQLALLLHEINAETNKERIEELLHLALANAQQLKLPYKTMWIENIMERFHIKPQQARYVHKQHGDVLCQ